MLLTSEQMTRMSNASAEKRAGKHALREVRMLTAAACVSI